MNAIIFHHHGGIDQLVQEDIPLPTLGEREILVKVKACALNHLDIWIRQGIPAYNVPLPHVSGSDVAGVIHQVGTDVTTVSVGDAVILSPGLSCWRCDWCLSGRDNLCPHFRVLGAQVDGGYAEYVKAPAVNAIPLPPTFSFEEAAAFPLVSVTAWHMLFSLANLQPGETILVMGAGSGVGSIAIQMASMIGARVLTTVGAKEKFAKAEALGADVVIDHSREDVLKRVHDVTKTQGAHVVIEHIGEQVWDVCLRALAHGGRLVTCGATTGGTVKVDLRHLFSRQLTIKGSYMGTRAELRQAIHLLSQGQLKPVVDKVFPLTEARNAQEYLLSRKAFGKVVLRV